MITGIVVLSFVSVVLSIFTVVITVVRIEITSSEKIGQLNEEVIKGKIREWVRGSVVEALIEMDLAGVSVRWVEDITEPLQAARSRPAPSAN